MRYAKWEDSSLCCSKHLCNGITQQGGVMPYEKQQHSVEVSNSLQMDSVCPVLASFDRQDRSKNNT